MSESGREELGWVGFYRVMRNRGCSRIGAGIAPFVAIVDVANGTNHFDRLYGVEEVSVDE
ncbi:hypothetical protein GCM10009039_14570 [Halocalculus aciditolerans]|uniref:Uncharacterized protein n=1 Tax=Halocalculus aciditolerans TaxID=1383812 RepID=A0A830FHU1_9EURY|nr:hypothetical protein GCM10009039_14570 [Halocalculus aciditolerans]